MPELPSGIITFLFTDIEGSTKLWEEYPGAMRHALARHDALVRAAIQSHAGVVFKTIGDGFCAAFGTTRQAVEAALAAQCVLCSEPWEQFLEEEETRQEGRMPLAAFAVRIRMALHVGVAEERDGDYFGQTINRVARLLAIGHGGQILLSRATKELIRDTLPLSASFKSLGEHRLRDLDRPEQVYQLLHPDLLSEFPALESLSSLRSPNNLPQQLTSFIGRRKETDDVKRLLAVSRLLTLTGSGGCGKTRLALEVAADVLDDYTDGVWLVELAPLADPALVPQTVANAVGVREVPGEPITTTLLSALKDRQMLLVVDNCEHVLDAAARLVDVVLKSCPKVKVLVSSREALGIAGENAYRVPSLSMPDPKQSQTPESLSRCDAVQLFIERAVSARPDFALSPQNVPAVASVCRRLDGIPLAIELAAARVRALPLEEINTRLDSRFRLLTGGNRTALPRHQTLRALIDWSYDLLNEQEKTLLCRLSVFAGGWRLEASEQVCAGNRIEDWEALDLLTSLVDKSLVVYEEQAGRAWYRLLETVRQYARDRLLDSGESDAVRERHRDCFLALAEEAAPKLSGPEQVEWLDRLEAEHENFRAALDWSLADDGLGAGLRICGALGRFWETRGHLSEGREWCERALGTAGGELGIKERAQVLNGVGRLARSQGDYASARVYYEESLTIYREIGDRRGIATSLVGLGQSQGDDAKRGDYASARVYYEESLTIYREIGDRRGTATSLVGLGQVALYSRQRDYVSARAYLDESLAIFREIEDRCGIGQSLHDLGHLAHLQSHASARAYYEESLTIYREIGDRRGTAMSLNALGDEDYLQGDYASARANATESLAIAKEVGDRPAIAWALCSLGQTASAQDDYGSARAYLDESLIRFREIGELLGITYTLSCLGQTASAQGDYASTRAYYEESLTIHRKIGEQINIAWVLHRLGQTASAQGDYASASGYYEESLTILRETRHPGGIARSLEAFAGLAANTGTAVIAATLWGSAEALRAEIGAPQAPEERKAYDSAVAKVHEVLGTEAFSAAWAKGRAMTMEEAIALALDGSAA